MGYSSQPAPWIIQTSQSYPLARSRGHHPLLTLERLLPTAPRRGLLCSRVQLPCELTWRVVSQLPGCEYMWLQLSSSSVHCQMSWVQHPHNPTVGIPLSSDRVNRRWLKHLFCPIHWSLSFFISLRLSNAFGKVINCSIMVIISGIVLSTFHTLSHLIPLTSQWGRYHYIPIL